MSPLQRDPASPHPVSELPEVCLNLWYVCDGSGFAYRLAARAYALHGTDDEKVRILQSLASSDFHVAPLCVVPQRYEIVTSGVKIAGLIPRAGILEGPSEVFREIIDAIEEGLPTQMRSVDGHPVTFKLKIQQDPLIVLTCVLEDETGRLTPIVAD